ncbi:lipoprotein-releasing ABC transporter permease subunit [Granulosicoccus antarcticus]|uniref:Lipoprotein-releasing system transmembrane protein LolC n=1 Tax=Granulosicoccus antarcticus IMCC3135 TaxID=1192854 RepID=A0A2Z2P5A3_9GAMM|nr:lipoprotein-releasing ABC transporter permease subunit [Granulosicoccus antarcticus]ASJ75014.1 Lipoprotein-releasing system transmembrane protein LolC [Granulosicoccus antarcticus IMCC3135]
MFQPYELFVGLRYTRAKRRNHFISFISLVSILGIMLGVTALITVTSVMNGFEKEMRERIVGASSHATVTGLGDSLENWQEIADIASAHSEVIGAAPYVEGQVMLVHAGRSTGALVRGVLPEEEGKVSELGDRLEYVESLDVALQPGEYGLLLGADLASYLGAIVGDKIMVITPEANVTPMGFVPRVKRFTVTGIFRFGMFQFDRNLAVMHAVDSAKLFKMNDQYSGVRLKLSDTSLAPQVSRDLQSELGYDNFVSDWTQQNANYFMAVKMEKTMMFIILSMIVAVAAFNIISTLVMLVQDKQADIAILRTQGASPASILSIFVVQGTLIGVLGTVAGLLGGVALASNIDVVVPFIERFTGPVLNPEVYYIDKMPSDLRSADVIKVGLMSFGLSLLATIYPAWRASRTDPARALAYE